MFRDRHVDLDTAKHLGHTIPKRAVDTNLSVYSVPTGLILSPNRIHEDHLDGIVHGVRQTSNIQVDSRSA